MTTTRDEQHTQDGAEHEEAPELILIGDASSVVLGWPGKGFDYDYGISVREFEFEQDGDL